MVNECNGALSQRFREDPSGTITHIQSGLVLDVLGAPTADGSPVGLKPAAAGVSNQLWTWPGN